MIEPGLFKHYKGNLYRVLFVADWWASDVRVFPDLPVYVVSYDHAIGVRASSRDAFLTAAWSGNHSVVLPIDTPIVIYVSLSSPGRVSARPLAEFAEQVYAATSAVQAQIRVEAEKGVNAALSTLGEETRKKVLELAIKGMGEKIASAGRY